MSKIWFKSGLVDEDKANIHIISHPLHYGGAVFEGIRSYKTTSGQAAIFRLDDHLDRLLYSCGAIGFSLKGESYSKDYLKKAIISVVRENNLDECYIRPIFFFDGGPMNLYSKNSIACFAASAWPWVYLEKNGLKTKISKHIRIHPDSAIVDAKISGQYSNSILATNEAVNSGFDEAILLDYKGNVAEGPGENIFIVKDGTIFTPSKGMILPGITRDTVISMAKKAGIKLKEKRIKKNELFEADEIFFTGTAVEICPVLEVDGRKIGNGMPGSITEIIMKEYKAIVHGERPEYQNWLTYI